MLDTPAPARAAAASPEPDGFSLHGVSFDVPGRRLLYDVTLDLPAGRVVGLVGHNGSGKSTLLKLLARQESPSAGRLAFAGRDISQWGSRDFARAVAYLPQSTPAAPGMSVRELVALGRYPWHGPFGRFSAADRQKVAEALALTDTEAMGDQAVDALSGGERQRVWLAMLVAQDARCLSWTSRSLRSTSRIRSRFWISFAGSATRRASGSSPSCTRSTWPRASATRFWR